MLKFSGSVIWRLGTRGSLRQHSGPVAGAAAAARDKLELAQSTADVAAKTDLSNDSPGLVAAAFASLSTPEGASSSKTPSPKSLKQSRLQQVESQIARAADVNSLLAVAEMPVVSRKHALKMVSTLSEWSSSNKVKLAQFEKDPRFLKLCRILARTPSAPGQAPGAAGGGGGALAEDLSTVLAITGDDEAARLITNLTLPQMVKVMKALQTKGRRSTPLLRALSHSITRQSDRIDLKRSADLLYCCASLNYPEPLLLDRICNDVIECLPSNEDKPAVVNSIAISLGLMKYRHEPVLSAIALWLRRRRGACRAGDVASALVTLATLQYQPAHTEDLIQTALSLREEELVRAGAWLDLVFALVTLRRAEPRHLLSTLQPDFIDRLLSVGEIGIPARRKLMMIDAYAALTLPSPQPPRLAEDVSVGVPLMHTKEKQLYVQSIMDTFKSLVSAEAFLKKDINSGMGFLYDAEFAVDSKCHPVPLEKAAKDKSIHRIAVLGLDYHDMSRKVPAPLGPAQLCTTLLALKGFKVLQIPYTEYNPKDKLMSRVQYVERRIRLLVSQAQA